MSMSLIRDLTTSETGAGDFVPSARIMAQPSSITTEAERRAAG
eukprot:CAMPEP_0119080800 /NCGR_PEP_ID=MMETSP1178-20130426/113717_1 /TAXON_ID=33656 /ORGANISM="unid sp, Strain CCMP2000" /LENGTH=42 /DNA_ID= /DNA_START= /DNA_END= /DNA_ORIENTATION=